MMLTGFVRLLSVVSIAQLIVLALVVLYAVAARTLGHSPNWYDEVASIMLAWLTFIGAALATARNAHLNFEGLLFSLPLPARKGIFIAGELVFHTAFGLVAWAGWNILEIFGGESLVSLPWIPLEFVHSIVPAGAGLVMFARLLVSRGNWERIVAGVDLERLEIEAEIARAREEMSRVGLRTDDPDTAPEHRRP
jgi:TRAP-type C4-dicarboxylate transport system permease small subunit